MTTKMMISEEIAIDMSGGWHKEDVLGIGVPGKPVVNEMIDQRRWSTLSRYVVPIGDRFFEFYLDAPSTESQEWSGMDVELTEVFPKEVTVIEYVKENSSA